MIERAEIVFSSDLLVNLVSLHEVFIIDLSPR
jgi:hypothetical protein